MFFDNAKRASPEERKDIMPLKDWIRLDHKIVVIAPNSWGAGDSLREAMKNVKRVHGSKPADWVAYVTPSSFDVHPVDGGLSWTHPDDADFLWDGFEVDCSPSYDRLRLAKQAKRK